MAPDPAPQEAAAPAPAGAPPLPLEPRQAAAGFSAEAPQGPAAPGSALESVIAQQLRLMTQQLELLRGGAHGAPAALASSPAAAPARPDPVPASPVRSRPAASIPAQAGRDAAGEAQPAGRRALVKERGDALTAQQQAALESLVARYCEKTKESKRLTEEWRPRLADNRTVAGFNLLWKEMVYQLVAERSQGARIWDVDGNEYLDLTLCFGANLLGHSPNFVVRAVEEQLHKGYEVGQQNPLVGEVTELICELTGNERVVFAHSGCEAVQYALRIARAVTGRDKVVFFENDIHGRADTVLGRTLGEGETLRTLPRTAGVSPQAVADSLVLEYGSDEALETIRAHAHELAAVLVEPVRTRNPDLQPLAFMRELRKITEEAGALLIFDEVVMGFRVHPAGAQGYFDIRADLATYGKVLGAGMPVGAVAGKAKYIDVVDGGRWRFGDDSLPEVGMTVTGGTMIKHPLSMAASRALLRHLKREGPALQRELNERTTRFVDSLNRHFEAEGFPIHVEHFSSYFLPKFRGDNRFEGLFFCYLRERGVQAYLDYPLFLSTAHSPADIEMLLEAFKGAAADMAAGGFLTRSGGAPPLPQPNGKPVATQGVVTGPVPLLPNQARFLTERGTPDPEYWGVCAMREAKEPLEPQRLREVVRHLLRHHDALRLRFRKTESGWEQFNAEPFEDVPLTHHDLSGLSDEAQQERLEALVGELRGSLDLAEGPLLAVAHVDLGPGKPQRLYVMLHHLAIDGLTLNYFWEDFETVYGQLSRGETLRLPPKTSSFKMWADTLKAYAQSGELRQQLDSWLALPWDQVAPLPRDYAADQVANTNASVRTLTVSLEPAETRALAFETPKLAYKADLIMAALTQSLAAWTGSEAVLFDMLGHGREDLFDHIDHSRTFGYFASYTPMVLRATASGAGSAVPIMRQIAQIREMGMLSHDLLRYMSNDGEVTAAMRALPRAEILFNYQGRLEQALTTSALFLPPTADNSAASDSPRGLRHYPLSIRGNITGEQLSLTFVYSKNLHKRRSIKRLAQDCLETLRGFIEEHSVSSAAR